MTFGVRSILDLSVCPCGGVPAAAAYAACCEPLHDRAREAETAERLMRSRYSAYALGREDHVFRTWHPRTRPDRTPVDPRTRWTGLQILETRGGLAEDTVGMVAFRAMWSSPAEHGELEERSAFERRGGRWAYVGPQP